MQVGAVMQHYIWGEDIVCKLDKAPISNMVMVRSAVHIEDGEGVSVCVAYRQLARKCTYLGWLRAGADQ